MDVPVNESPFTIKGGIAMKTSMVGSATVDRNQSQGGGAALMKAACFLLTLAVMLEAHPAWAQI